MSEFWRYERVNSARATLIRSITMQNLAKSHLALGHEDDARRLYEELVKRYQGTQGPRGVRTNPPMSKAFTSYGASHNVGGRFRFKFWSLASHLFSSLGPTEQLVS